MEIFSGKLLEQTESKPPETALSRFWDDIEKGAEAYRAPTPEERIKSWWNELADGDERRFTANQSPETLNTITEKGAQEGNLNTRLLTDDERAHYKETIGCSDNVSEKCSVDENGKLHLITINKDKEGQTGADGVTYERKTVVINGVEVEGVFPKFDSTYNVSLPDDLLGASDDRQAQHCNGQLSDAVDNAPKLAAQFTLEQLAQIKNKETPDGFTWHHNEETGKMQLVKTDDHQNNRHTGGRAIWGGGQTNR